MLMIFYLNVFQLPTLIQVVGQYKMWNKVVFWFAEHENLGAKYLL